MRKVQLPSLSPSKIADIKSPLRGKSSYVEGAGLLGLMDVPFIIVRHYRSVSSAGLQDMMSYQSMLPQRGARSRTKIV